MACSSSVPSLSTSNSLGALLVLLNHAQLSREDDPHLNASSPLAYVDTEAPGPGLTLVISSEATPFTEEILASFIIQELTLERQEKISGVAYGVAYNSSIPF